LILYSRFSQKTNGCHLVHVSIICCWLKTFPSKITMTIYQYLYSKKVYSVF
jgi:hypothetical protein